MNTYRAVLRGASEVPPVRTPASGNAVFRLNPAGNRLMFTLVVRNIHRFTQAHIHLGRRGENGPVVAFLFGPSSHGISVRRGVVRGSVAAAALTGPLKGRPLRELIAEMNRGNAYVNAHTAKHPDGEIRGQIIRAAKTWNAADRRVAAR